MSTRLAPTAACVGTFIVLMHLTTAGVIPTHRSTLPHLWVDLWADRVERDGVLVGTATRRATATTSASCCPCPR
jgi:hypothetical protein